MCKEGIRIGRRTVARTSQWIINQGESPTVLPPNPNRVGFIVSSIPNWYLSPQEYAAVGTVIDGTLMYWGTLCLTTPTMRFGVEEYGQLVTDAVVLINGAGGGSVFWVTELYLTEALPQL